MAKYLGSVVVVLLGVACGGTTDINDPSGGGASAGGAGSGGKNAGGSAGTTGGIGMGGSAVTGGFGGAGGSMVVAGSGGIGGKWVDPRCPEQRPMGECREAGLACRYDQFNGCLCYSGVYGFCDQVDPDCPNGSSAGGVGGGPPAARAQDTGGFSTKIAVPPQQLCTCLNSSWNCSFGF